MTTDAQDAQEPVYQWVRMDGGEQPEIHWALPEEYTYVRFFLNDTLPEQIARAEEGVALIRDSEVLTYHEPPPAQREAPPPQPPTQPAQQRPQPAQARSRAPARRGGGQRRQQRPSGTGLFCGEHPNVEVIETKREWQEYDEDGNPDKFFCPGDQNGQKTHSVYRRQTATYAGGDPRDEDDLPF
jgi:hypothetical protein